MCMRGGRTEIHVGQWMHRRNIAWFKSDLLYRRCWLVRHLEARYDGSHRDRLQRRHSVVLVVELGRDVSYSVALEIKVPLSMPD